MGFYGLYIDVLQVRLLEGDWITGTYSWRRGMWEEVSL